MPQYMLSVHHPDDQPVPPQDELQQIFADVDAFNAKVKAAGQWVFGGGLHPSSTATTVYVKNGDVVMTDGPYVETKEQLGGFWVVKAPDLDAALALAADAVRACRNQVEVRPFQDEPED